ncbi:MAG: DUF3866 family protein [Bifidobacteriaceae bacterium]|nr:DUF3866 family protein [Bifidobacteriaceae bacterium]
MEAWTRFAQGRVVSVDATRPGAQELTCAIGHRSVRALAYTGLVPALGVGDRVILNTAALDAALGTGGWAFVVAPGDDAPAPDAPAASPSGPAGYLVKARYTPLQAMVRGIDEQTSPHHRVLAEATDIDAMPVVTADLHSSVPAVLAGIHADAPGLRVVYVMADGGALPLPFSRTVAALEAAGSLAATVTAGQAYGGTVEAATVHSALLAARLVVGADIAIVTQGPGNLGTGTHWGFSGVAVGEAVNAIATLGGRPVGTLRVSGADPRPRHRGLSHHSITAYGQVALRPAMLAVPDFDGRGEGEPEARAPMTRAWDLPEVGDAIVRGLAELVPPRGIHQAVRVPTDGLMAALEASPAPMTTMGRTLHDDPAAFLAAACAGRLAASLVATTGRRESR